MSGLLDQLQYFHFLRSWILLAIPLVVLAWWYLRSKSAANAQVAVGVAEHLARALTVGREGRRRFQPIDGLALSAVVLAVAAAGPTWSRIPNPLVAPVAPVAAVLSMSETMLETDVAPSRLERSKHKLLDLLDARAGGRTALIAYAGSAHLVTPLSEDPEIMKPFIEGLSPKVMPKPGANAGAALDVAAAALAGEPMPGAIVFILDDFASSDALAFAEYYAEGGDPVIFLAVGASKSALAAMGRVPRASVVAGTNDGGDLLAVERRIASAYRAALAQDDRQQWDDRGWLLAWPAMLLTLLYFRRGWSVLATVALVWTVVAASAPPAYALGAEEPLLDWFLTPDQQGRIAFDDLRYEDAAALFQEPMWKGQALYEAGDYLEAAAVFEGVQSADAAFAEGMARIKGREYAPAIEAFEKALERDPNHEGAKQNVVIAREILDYLLRVREASDTGEQGVGADEVVFDNESERGNEQRMGARNRLKVESAEQWMRTVNTLMEDFLRSRFGFEAARRAE